MQKAQDTPNLDTRPSKAKDKARSPVVQTDGMLFWMISILFQTTLTRHTRKMTFPARQKRNDQPETPETVPMTTWLCQMDNVLFTTCGLPKVFLPLFLELLVPDPIDEIPSHLVHPKMLTFLLRRISDADDNDQKSHALLPLASLAKDFPMSYEDLSGLFVDMFRFNKVKWSSWTNLNLVGLISVAMKRGRVEVWASFRSSGVWTRRWLVDALSSSAGWRLSGAAHELVREALTTLPFARCLIADMGLEYADFICEGALLDDANLADWMRHAATPETLAFVHQSWVIMGE